MNGLFTCSVVDQHSFMMPAVLLENCRVWHQLCTGKVQNQHIFPTNNFLIFALHLHYNFTVSFPTQSSVHLLLSPTSSSLLERHCRHSLELKAKDSLSSSVFIKHHYFMKKSSKKVMEFMRGQLVLLFVAPKALQTVFMVITVSGIHVKTHGEIDF